MIKITLKYSCTEAWGYILARYAEKFCEQLDLDAAKIIDEMLTFKSDHYENMFNVFEKYFGTFTTIVYSKR